MALDKKAEARAKIAQNDFFSTKEHNGVEPMEGSKDPLEQAALENTLQSDCAHDVHEEQESTNQGSLDERISQGRPETIPSGADIMDFDHFRLGPIKMINQIATLRDNQQQSQGIQMSQTEADQVDSGVFIADNTLDHPTTRLPITDTQLDAQNIHHSHSWYDPATLSNNFESISALELSKLNEITANKVSRKDIWDPPSSEEEEAIPRSSQPRSWVTHSERGTKRVRFSKDSDLSDSRYLDKGTQTDQIEETGQNPSVHLAFTLGRGTPGKEMILKIPIERGATIYLPAEESWIQRVTSNSS